MLIGYCVLYDVLSEPGVRGPCTTELFEPGAFTASLALARRRGTSIPCLLNHDPRTVLGATADGRLRLFPEDWGVRFELRGHGRPAGFTGMSFTFRRARVRGRGILRRVVEADLVEISVCTVPVAFPVTKSTVKEVRA